MTRILVVDDEPGFRRSLAITLRREGYDVAEASGGGDAIDQLGRHEVALIITDLKMQDMSGLQLLEHVRGVSPGTEVIVMTAFGTIEIAVEAMRGGAFDFVTKPFQLEEILHRTRNALERRRLRREVHALRVEATKTRALSNIVGVSPAMQEVRALIPRVAQVDSAVLVTGESGTGKELVARAIHEASRRATGPFVAVSCAALPVDLLESELFGHVKGAFTGAHTNRTGLFEEASGGTLLLDEVGDTPLPIQAKLLRALQERTIRRVGDNRSIPIDIRVVAATMHDLTADSKAFREDLYFRLNVIRMRLAPLRERPDDIPVLARHFLTQHANRAGRSFDGIAPEAMEALSRYRFQGNVRELSNIVEQAVALATGVLLELDDLPDNVRADTAAGDLEAPGARRPLDAMERELILARLRLHGGDLQAVAADLHMSRTTLWRRMKQYRIDTNP